MLVASQVAPGKPEILHYPEVPDEERQRRHGVGTHSAIAQLTVSEPTTVTFRFEIGEMAVVTGGELLVVWRWPFDWSDLQFDDPAGAGFTQAKFTPAADRAADSVRLELRYNWIAGIEPWHHQLQIKIVEGELQTGDVVEVVCGDMAGGGSGWRAPTCVADRCRFLMLIDHQGNGTRTRLVQEPPFQVTPGPPERLTAIVHSDAVVGEPVELILRAEDCWGNPTQLGDVPAIVVEPDGGDVERALVGETPIRPVERYRLSFPKAGRYRIQVSTGSLELSATSNEVTVHESRPEEQLFWGDVHSGQTEIGCGCGSLAEHYAFGRDCAGLQFTTHQANDHYVTIDEWAETRNVTDEYYESGRYVPFLGCEWSPLTKDGGDRNVFYLHDEPKLRRSDRFFREDHDDPEPDVRTAPEFHDAFRDLDVLVNIHVGGRMTNLEWYEQKIEKLCETHSTHGTVEWFFMDALSRGYRVGLTAGTDGVMGRPGACHPGRRLIRNLRNGLTGLYAKELTREALWDAFQNRCCFATTGERIRVWFEANDTPMGAETETDGPLNVSFSVHGTHAIERVDLFQGVEIIESWPVAPSASEDESTTLRVLWGGTERKGTARLQRVDWTGSLQATGGPIELLDTINFQSYDDAARSIDSQRIEWANKSAGNAAGIVVRVCGSEATRLQFDSGPARFEIDPLAAVSDEVSVDAGGLNRFVRVGTPPNPAGPRSFEMQTTIDAGTGEHVPYWIRITQVDQSLAWSSPVYVTRKP